MNVASIDCANCPLEKWPELFIVSDISRWWIMSSGLADIFRIEWSFGEHKGHLFKISIDSQVFMIGLNAN
jgi:hypothetical protein